MKNCCANILLHNCVKWNWTEDSNRFLNFTLALLFHLFTYYRSSTDYGIVNSARQQSDQKLLARFFIIEKWRRTKITTTKKIKSEKNFLFRSSYATLSSYKVHVKNIEFELLQGRQGDSINYHNIHLFSHRIQFSSLVQSVQSWKIVFIQHLNNMKE